MLLPRVLALRLNGAPPLLPQLPLLSLCVVVDGGGVVKLRWHTRARACVHK